MDVTDSHIVDVFPKKPPGLFAALYNEQYPYGEFPDQFEADMQQPEATGGANQDFVAPQSIRKAVKADKGIRHNPEDVSETEQKRSSDTKLINRSKAKIYTYRDSKGRLVFTNYAGKKSRTNKK
jgi:hypothetical protein